MERQKEKDHQFTGSLNSQQSGLAQAEARSWELRWGLPHDRNSSTWAINCCASDAPARSCIGSKELGLTLAQQYGMQLFHTVVQPSVLQPQPLHSCLMEQKE